MAVLALPCHFHVIVTVICKKKQRLEPRCKPWTMKPCIAFTSKKKHAGLETSTPEYQNTSYQIPLCSRQRSTPSAVTENEPHFPSVFCCKGQPTVQLGICMVAPHHPSESALKLIHCHNILALRSYVWISEWSIRKIRSAAASSSFITGATLV